MQSGKIRLISVDMDGTFLSPEGGISKNNLAAVKAAQDAGIVFAIATGRFYENAAIGIRDWGLDCPLITVNGGKIAASPFGEVISEHMMSKESAMEAFRILEEQRADYYVFAKNRVAIRGFEDRHHSQIEFGDERMRSEANTRYFYGADACLELIDEGIYKYYVHAYDDLEKLGRIRWALEEGITRSVLTHSGAYNIEIMPTGIDKGSGVAELAQYLHIGLDEVMAIGDQDNDLPMIRLAGWGVAMGNATEDVKSQAKMITLSNAEDGVAYAIRRYALGQA